MKTWRRVSEVMQGAEGQDINNIHEKLNVPNNCLALAGPKPQEMASRMSMFVPVRIFISAKATCRSCWLSDGDAPLLGSRTWSEQGSSRLGKKIQSAALAEAACTESPEAPIASVCSDALVVQA